MALGAIEFNPLVERVSPWYLVPEEPGLSYSNDNLIVMEKNNPGSGQEICVIYSTVPPARSADLAGRLLEKNLVACINITPVRSLYRWKGESCDEEEHLLIIKTRQGLADAVIRALKAMHPYEVPEIIVLPVITGHAPYLDWVHEQTRGS